MEKWSRSELLSTIESQKEQLKRYESRLRDVVRAYKGLVTEKEALEASVKVLTPAPPADPSTPVPVHSPQEPHPLAHQQADEGQAEGGEDVLRMREQIQTLSSSLATLTQEKSRLESSLLADKKKLRVENDDLRRALDVEITQRQSETSELQSQLAEVKGCLRGQQLERETEQTNHGIMLKELQLLLAEERSTREQLEHQIESVQLAHKEDSGRSKEEEQEAGKTIVELTKQLDAARKQLKTVSQTKAQESSSPVLSELKNEMEKMKKNYQVQVSEESRRANDAEMRLSVCAKQSEERISSLECKLSEISSIMGNYDKVRLKDQDVISRLRERVSQLDNENAVLSTAVTSTPSSGAAAAATATDHNLDMKTLTDKLLYYYDLLLAANEKTDSPVDVASLLRRGDDSGLDHGYKEQLESLREEFERYKLRAQSVLKTKKDGGVGGAGGSRQEVEGLREQVSQLRERMRQQHQEHADSVQAHSGTVQHLTNTLHLEQEKHRQRETQLASQHAKQIREMEQQLRKQRDRTITMLAEKENEIVALKNASGHSFESESYREGMYGEVEGRESSEERETEGLSALFVDGGVRHTGDTLVLHVAQEQARREVELGVLRRERRQAEGALRDLQHSTSLKLQALHEENETLTEEIRKQQRNFKRENANLEYLKNVTFNFLTSADRHGKKQMLKAIMTILQFSPREVEKVDKSGSI